MTRFFILVLILLLNLTACNEANVEGTAEASPSATSTQSAPQATDTPLDEANEAIGTEVPVNALAGTSTPTEGASAEATTVTIEQPESYPAPPTAVASDGSGSESYPAAATVVSIDDDEAEAEAEAEVEVESEPQAESAGTAVAEGSLACVVAPHSRFASLLQSQPELATKLACPIFEPEETFAAAQPFERGNQMFWLANQKAILAMYEGQWHGYADTFEEGEPESPPGAPLPPNETLLQPLRGFGKVWLNIQEEMGFALLEELGYDATLQRFQGGWLMTIPYDQVLFLQGLSDFQQGFGHYQLWIEQNGQWIDQAPPNGS